ncbi:MAG: Ni-sirohydrochlorin a,c-diamide synthase, partial [Methanosarcinales archaeon]
MIKGNTTSTSTQNHEFHHSSLENLPKNTNFAIKLTRGIGIKKGCDGILVNNTLASYSLMHAV